jgi:hypothetical protein
VRPAAATTGAARRRARLAVAAAASIAVACVTTYEPAEPGDGEALPFAAPVSIPLTELGGAGSSRVQLEFFGGILRRLQDAAADGDAALIDSLVESYDLPNVPESFRQHLVGYRAIARGIRFQQHVQQRGLLRLVGDAAEPAPAPEAARRAPPLGEPLRLELELPPMTDAVRLGALGDDDPVGFSVGVTVEDEFVDGSSRESQSKEFLWLPRAIELRDESLSLPVEVGAAAGDAVRRSVVVRVDLMPGYVTIDELRAPIQRVTAGAITCTQWPVGYEVLAEQPLAALRAALADFNPKNYAGAYLSALLVPAQERREATALLIDQVRFGRADQAQVAMAALHRTAGVNISVGDRDGWLSWWQSRQ